MASLRNILTTSLSNIASILPSQLLQKVANAKLILPFYHAISDKACPHIENLYPVKNTKAFIKDLDFLLKYYEPIDYFTFKELCENNNKPKRPSFLLSFDDGLSEFNDIIAPILLKKGIPAVCFLNSNFIDNKDLFYRYKASLLINKIKSEDDKKRILEKYFVTNKSIYENILSIDYNNRNLLDEMASLINYNFKDFLTNNKPYLTSDQINSLIDNGFYFGAHSIDHPRYFKLPLEEQIRQTQESVIEITNRFSLNYKIFSFPFTDYKVSKQLFSYLQNNNIVDCSFGCAGYKNDSAQNNYQRIAFEQANYSAKEILNAELFYYLLKIPIGKNLIKR